MSISPTLSEMQENGFPLGGESSVALDLVDTVVNAHGDSTDLLATNAESWWRLQSSRLPESAPPTESATQRLRTALRDAFEAAIDGQLGSGTSIAVLNRAAASALTSPLLEIVDGAPRLKDHWSVTGDGNPRLAVIARDAITLLGDSVLRQQLRRCANPTCSMLFRAENPRRIWCASNICGNRARVARHQQRRLR